MTDEVVALVLEKLMEAQTPSDHATIKSLRRFSYWTKILSRLGVDVKDRLTVEEYYKCNISTAKEDGANTLRKSVERITEDKKRDLPSLCKDISHLRKTKKVKPDCDVSEIEMKVSRGSADTVLITAKKISREFAEEKKVPGPDKQNNQLRRETPRKMSFKDLGKPQPRVPKEPLRSTKVQICSQKGIQEEIDNILDNIPVPLPPSVQASSSSLAKSVGPSSSRSKERSGDVPFLGQTAQAQLPPAQVEKLSQTTSASRAPEAEEIERRSIVLQIRPKISFMKDLVKCVLCSQDTWIKMSDIRKHYEHLHKLSQEIVRVHPNHFTEVHLNKFAPARKDVFGCSVCPFVESRRNPEKLLDHFKYVHKMKNSFRESVGKVLLDLDLPDNTRRWIKPESINDFFQTSSETFSNPFDQRINSIRSSGTNVFVPIERLQRSLVSISNLRPLRVLTNNPKDPHYGETLQDLQSHLGCRVIAAPGHQETCEKIYANYLQFTRQMGRNLILSRERSVISSQLYRIRLLF